MMSSHREAEARLNRLLHWVDREVGEAMADSGFCQVCRTGVLEKRGRRYRCKSCGTPQDLPAPTTTTNPSGGHNTRTSSSTWNKHTDDHPSRTGQKKRLRFRRTDKKKKRQKESEEELTLFEDFL